MKPLFNSALLRLTLIYTSILLMVSIVFSVSFYQVSVRELDASFVAQNQIIQRRGPFGNQADEKEFYEEQLEGLDESKQRLTGRLLLGNIIVLSGSVLMSYFLAKKSLEPIEEAHEAVASFTADASHELRTPLTAMQTEIEVSLRDPKLSKTEAKQLLSSNLEELKKLSGLSDALLKLARRDISSDSDQQQLNLYDELSQVSQRLKPQASAKQIKVKVKCGRKLTLNAEPDTFAELLVILLDNAIKYSPANSTISLSAEKRNRYIYIKVSDKGDGIKATELAHIFERFYRADSSRTKQGYGLGLSLAKQIVELHNGQISVDSTPGEGTTFTVKLSA